MIFLFILPAAFVLAYILTKDAIKESDNPNRWRAFKSESNQLHFFVV